MKNGYHIFLLIELARIANVIPKELEYDLTWEKGLKLYNLFEGSDFNKASEPEYECIIDFLKDYKKTNTIRGIFVTGDTHLNHLSFSSDNKEHFNNAFNTYKAMLGKDVSVRITIIQPTELTPFQKDIVSDHEVQIVKSL